MSPKYSIQQFLEPHSSSSFKCTTSLVTQWMEMHVCMNLDFDWPMRSSQCSENNIKRSHVQSENMMRPKEIPRSLSMIPIHPLRVGRKTVWAIRQL
jgi:hypothetical protein